MPRRPKGELSHVEGKGYRVCVGTRKSDDDKVRPAVFWIGHDLEVARFKAHMYRRIWNDPHRNGEPWTAETIRLTNEQIRNSLAMIRRVYERHDQEALILSTLRPLAFPIKAATGPSPTDAPLAPGGAKTAPAMLHAALDGYVTAVAAKALSNSYRRRIGETIGDLKAFRPDGPLSAIDRVWIEQLTDWVKGRPLAAKQNKLTGRREPIKPATVKTYLQHWRQAFDWIDHASDSDRFGRWEAPKRMADLFAADINKLRTKAERDKAADGPDQLTVAEIVRLYRVVDADNDLHRIIVMMGVFTAQGQSELACTRRDEFDLDAAAFTHRRNKTGQKGVYWLPPELVAMLRSYFVQVGSAGDGLAFRTRTGAPLVVDKTDSVGQMFAELRERAGITRPGVTFYACRRFLADRAARAGGDSLRDTALAHTAKTVGGRHYSNYRDFAGLKQVSRELHSDLTAAGMFAAPAIGESERKPLGAATPAA